MSAGEKQTHWILVVVVLLSVPFIGSHSAEGAQATWSIVLNTLLLLPVMGVLVIVQQAVVVVAARLLGDRAINMLIGVGPCMLERSRGLFTLRLHLLPVFGSNVIVSTREQGQRLRLILALTAGAMAVAAVGIGIIAVHSPTELMRALSTQVTVAGTLLVAVLVALGLWALIVLMAIANPDVMGDTPALRHLRGLAHLYEASEHVLAGAHVDAEKAARRGLEVAPDLDAMQLVHLASLMELGVDAATEALSHLEIEKFQPTLHAAAHNLRAWAIYRRNAVELLDRADESSRIALERSDDASTRDTRGHVLLWLRRFDEAAAHLQIAYESGRPSTRACAAVGLALVHEGKQNHGEAVTWLNKAREMDAYPWLVARATAVIEPLRRD